MLRIVIVDNNLDLCETVEAFLGSQDDMKVVGIADDGEKALDVIKAQAPDVVILDITMPHLDGLGVLERFKDMRLARWPRVIVLTALGREDIIQRFTELGADYFILKPFDLDLLAVRIRQFASDDPPSVVRHAEPRKNGRSSHDVEAEITRLLREMGVPAHFKGYNYLRDAVIMVLREEGLIGGSLTKRLYPTLAEKYDSTAGGVEAAIRNALIAAWEHGNREWFEHMLGRASVRKKRVPTNSMIIAKLADSVRIEQRAGEQAAL